MPDFTDLIQRAPGTDPLVPQPVKGRRMATPDAATMRKLQAQGEALKNAKGEPSYQIRNATDLDNAIKAIGRVRPNTDAARAKVRRYVVSRAKALGLSSRIPDTWAADGTLKDDGDDSTESGPDTDDTAGKYDPDGDGDDDATPAGDTDHSHWSADGRQLKPVPGKPMSAKAMKAARIFAGHGSAA